MIPTIDEIKEIIKNTEHANIDIEKTISNTIKSGWMHEDYFVLNPYNCLISDMIEDDGLEYERLSEDYFNYVYKILDDEGIYIALAYASEEET